MDADLDDKFEIDIFAELDRLSRLFDEHERRYEAEVTRNLLDNLEVADKSAQRWIA